MRLEFYSSLLFTTPFLYRPLFVLPPILYMYSISAVLLVSCQGQLS